MRDVSVVTAKSLPRGGFGPRLPGIGVDVSFGRPVISAGVVGCGSLMRRYILALRGRVPFDGDPARTRGAPSRASTRRKTSRAE